MKKLQSLLHVFLQPDESPVPPIALHAAAEMMEGGMNNANNLSNGHAVDAVPLLNLTCYQALIFKFRKVSVINHIGYVSNCLNLNVFHFTQGTSYVRYIQSFSRRQHGQRDALAAAQPAAGGDAGDRAAEDEGMMHQDVLNHMGIPMEVLNHYT